MGEVVGPTVGPAIRRRTIYGDLMSVPVRDSKTEGAPVSWLNIWGPSPRTPPCGKATGDGWGAIYVLPVAKGRPYLPVHIVEEALTDSAMANYFESSPQQAVAWRNAAP
eukprot:4429129-Pyramimonas_sp.AAC.1